MSHSHIAVRHLLKQLETYRNAERPQRDIRPDWLVALIDRVAELFDPHEEVARAGYLCRLTEEAWEVDVFLGAVERVGGPEDGSCEPAGFRFDLRSVESLFTELTAMQWQSVPEPDEGTPRTTVHLHGHVDGNAVRLVIHSRPINDAGPALRKYPDGRVDVV